jgi:transposase
LTNTCHNATQLFKEVGERGYNGAKTPLINYVTQLRQQLEEPDIQRTGRKPTTQLRPLSDHLYNPRQITRWFMRDSEKLRVSQQEKLENLCRNIPDLGVSFQLVVQFKTIFRQRQDEELTAWLETAERCGVSEVVSFARGIRRDEEAVRNSIKLPWSNGPVEGEVNKLKLIKRTMYGKAKFELLRARVLAG